MHGAPVAARSIIARLIVAHVLCTSVQESHGQNAILRLPPESDPCSWSLEPLENLSAL